MIGLLAERVPTPVPIDRNCAVFGLDAHARVSARQTALEPSNATVDKAMSWSVWLHQHNLGTNATRVFGVQMTGSGNQQYVLQTLAQDMTPTSRNQRLNFSIFTDGSNFITVESTNRFLRGRSYHVVITYSGSEAASGFKMYLNGVEDTTANKFMTGTYTGARNDANNRMILSRVDSSSTRYRGSMRDLAVWNRVLTSSEVTELYNAGAPFTISGLSWYAAAIVSWWPFTASLASSNSSSYDFGTANSISIGTTKLSPTYESISFFNADPSNTRYIAFGGSFWNNPGWDINVRSGTNHLANGKIVNFKFNPSDLSVTSPVDVLTDGTYDLRNVSTGKIDGTDIAIFLARFTHTTGPFIDLLRFTSTDKLVGQTFGSGVSMTTDTDRYSFYGKVIRGDNHGEYLVCEYEYNTAATAYQVNVFKRDAGGTWSKINVWSGDNTAAYTESCICKVAKNTYFILSRSEVLVGLHLFISTDGAATWSGPFATGMGGGVCMADMAMSPHGLLAVVFGDRSINRLVLSSGNPIADIIADKTDWKNQSQVFQSYAADSTGILGYPSISFRGEKVCITVVAEHSSSRADLYVGYGLLG